MVGAVHDELCDKLPMRADFALLRGLVVDTFGNIQYYSTTRNWNSLMATAADHVIVSACQIQESKCDQTSKLTEC